MFGPHLTLDLHGCDKKKLSDYDYVYRILDTMPGLLGMNKFATPQLTSVPSPGKDSFDRGGLTGFVILIESHMAIHTFPEDSYASFDIFSCKDFDIDFAVKSLMKLLGSTRVEKNFITRGKEFAKHYPRSTEKAAEIVMRERTTVAH